MRHVRWRKIEVRLSYGWLARTDGEYRISVWAAHVWKIKRVWNPAIFEATHASGLESRSPVRTRRWRMHQWLQEDEVWSLYVRYNVRGKDIETEEWRFALWSRR